MKRDFLALSQYTRQELDDLFILTRELKDKQKKGIPHHHLAIAQAGVAVQQRADHLCFAAAQFQDAQRPAQLLGKAADQFRARQDGFALAQVLHWLQTHFPIKIPKSVVLWHG